MRGEIGYIFFEHFQGGGNKKLKEKNLKSQDEANSKKLFAENASKKAGVKITFLLN